MKRNKIVYLKQQEHQGCKYWYVYDTKEDAINMSEHNDIIYEGTINELGKVQKTLKSGVKNV